MNLDEMVDKFLSHIIVEKNLSSNTASAYKNDLNKFKIFIEKEKININKFDYENITSFLIFLKKRNYSASSVIRILSGIRNFYKFLIARGYVKNSVINIE
ncbi:MAG: site-specific integrase, partial [bacterium]|nr:site-specific integrase [bacterium]